MGADHDALGPAKLTGQLNGRKMNHGRASMGTGVWCLARFQLPNHRLHLLTRERLPRLDGRCLANPLDHQYLQLRLQWLPFTLQIRQHTQ